MKNLKVLALCAMVAGIFISCEKNEEFNNTQSETSSGLTAEHQNALREAGVNPVDAKYSSIEDPDGLVRKGILAGTKGFQDIFIALDDLKNQKLSDESSDKQYVTNSLVARNSVISVVGYTGNCSGGGSCALTTKMREGLQRAINNYNRINISLRFELTFSARTRGADMIIFNPGGSDAGGVAEFPSGGNPGRLIQIFGGMDQYNVDVNEHVITHEMGHALGFRHTDYARRKCGGADEGISNFGARRVPGTPLANRWGESGLDSNSIMISCFDGSEDGELSRLDIAALEFIY